MSALDMCVNTLPYHLSAALTLCQSHTTQPRPRKSFAYMFNGHASDCVCGACGCAFDLVNAAAPDLCSCGTDVYDEGEQKCTIM